ncbi:MAG: PRC-barrel domain protein [ANME-2 cluster archaeon HR1]|jgi:sporulation protein YlmC with PRC-barrel domain|nr:MAG: Sporulation protein YlmC, PRC-barrel domain family [ANME-2 cluster archaeon]KAF5426852.1 Sporulation protein YlmC, PRC-barrel domain family [ANME-2 cluster archaeon]PPA78486.1 MAG: PRC-barrel domain protein [ANME-2 cluster archaeon HR1]
MMQIFAKNLRNKQVMSSDGMTIGILSNLVIDVNTGNIIDLVIKPDMGLDKEKFKVDDDFVLISFDAVRAIKDYIVVDKKASMAS